MLVERNCVLLCVVLLAITPCVCGCTNEEAKVAMEWSFESGVEMRWSIR